MMHLLWLMPLVTGLATTWLGRLHSIALMVALICGLIGVAHLILRPRGRRPDWGQSERLSRETVERDIPPNPG